MTQLIWITGASSGIGRAAALLLAQQGHKVIISSHEPEPLQATAALHPNLVPLVVDVTDTAAVKTAMLSIEQFHGALDIAILNAGGWDTSYLGKVDIQNMQQTLDLNVVGPVRALEYLVPRFKKRGRGHIVLTASIAGYTGWPRALAYCASKAAVMSMAQTLHHDLTPHGVKVQVIVPGFVKSGLSDRNPYPMPFMTTPEKAAEAIVRGLKSRRFEIAFPWQSIWISKLIGILPYSLYRPVMLKVAALGEKYKRGM